MATTYAIWADGHLLGGDPSDGSDLGDGGGAAVAAQDLSFARGWGLFETARVTDGVVAEHERHMERLLGSAVALGIAADRSRIEEGIAAVLALAPAGAARLRYTVSGSGAYVVELTETVPQPEVVRCVTAAWPRVETSPLVGHKLTSYADSVWALAEARRAGADEALFRNTRGDYCEGTMSNLFVVVDGHLVTPPRDAGILPGVTREVVIERMRAAGVTVAEVAVSPVDLYDADEVMITGSVKGVVPVVRVDGATFDVGPITRRIQGLMGHD